MNTNFARWLQEQLDSRGWNQTDLVNSARAQGYKLTSSQISRIISGDQDGGITAVIAIAAGLGFSREMVFRARGWLPNQTNHFPYAKLDPQVEQLALEVNALSSPNREITLNLIKAVLESARQYTDKISKLSTNGHESQKLTLIASQTGTGD